MNDASLRELRALHARAREARRGHRWQEAIDLYTEALRATGEAGARGERGCVTHGPGKRAAAIGGSQRSTCIRKPCRQSGRLACAASSICGTCAPSVTACRATVRPNWPTCGLWCPWRTNWASRVELSMLSVASNWPQSSPAGWMKGWRLLRRTDSQPAARRPPRRGAQSEFAVRRVFVPGAFCRGGELWPSRGCTGARVGRCNAASLGPGQVGGREALVERSRRGEPDRAGGGGTGAAIGQPRGRGLAFDRAAASASDLGASLWYQRLALDGVAAIGDERRVASMQGISASYMTRWACTVGPDPSASGPPHTTGR